MDSREEGEKKKAAAGLWSQAFDTTGALSGMYLWLLFGLLATTVNCDLQRLLQESALVRHAVSLTAFFFLFTFLDAQARTMSLAHVWVKTLVVYALFVLTTRSKWYFALPVLALLLLDQVLKRHAATGDPAGPARDARDARDRQRRTERVSGAINKLIIAVILVGAVHYAWLQRVEYGKAFSFAKFIFGTNRCKARAPDYTKFMAGRRRAGTSVFDLFPTGRLR